MAAPEDVLARALAYPFGIPEGSYALVAGEAAPLHEAELAGGEAPQIGEAEMAGGEAPQIGEAELAGGEAPLGEDRVAVLAFGANASPAALAAKLGPLAREARVAVVAGELRDFDVVYSAHVSPYGSIPGTLQRSPGAVAPVHAIHLDSDQLARMHRSEPNYEFSRLHGIDLRLEGGRRLDAVHAYVSRHGCLVRDGGHVGVAAIPVRGRAWPALGEAEILAAVRDELAPGEELAGFVLAHVADPELAADRTRRLRTGAEPLAWPHVEAAG